MLFFQRKIAKGAVFKQQNQAARKRVGDIRQITQILSISIILIHFKLRSQLISEL